VKSAAGSKTEVMPPFTPLGTLARWTCIALYACAGFYALSAAALPGNLAQLDPVAEYEQATGETVHLQSTPSSDFAAIGLAAFVLTAILFLVFFHRAYSNLSTLAPAERRYSTGWAVGSWFIPILSLFRPKQIANDIWRGSDGSRVPPVFHWWWAFFLVGGIAFFGYDKEQVTVSEAKTVVFVQAAGEVILMGAALCAAAMVRLIARRQGLRADLMGERDRVRFLTAPERIG
jgi:hypothetical protein